MKTISVYNSIFKLGFISIFNTLDYDVSSSQVSSLPLTENLYLLNIETIK